MAKKATPVYAASILHKPVNGKETVSASTNLRAITDLDAIQEARDWAISLFTDECTVLQVTRGVYQIRRIRMERLAARRPESRKRSVEISS
jgi:hypothetical protein